MKLINRFITKSLCLVLISNFISLGIINNIQASLITSSDLLTEPTLVQSESEFNSALQREYIQNELITMGVESDLVIARVDSMSDIEIQQLSSSIKNKEAGGNPILIGLAVVGVGFLVFYLWLMSGNFKIGGF